jgi:hypothetical protein
MLPVRKSKIRNKKKPPSKTWREAIPKTDYIFCSLGRKEDMESMTCHWDEGTGRTAKPIGSYGQICFKSLWATPPILKMSCS